jgi:hypothetical protein
MFGREMVLTLLSEPYRGVEEWRKFVQSIRTAPTYWWLLLMVVVSLSLLVCKNDRSFIQLVFLVFHRATVDLRLYIYAFQSIYRFLSIYYASKTIPKRNNENEMNSLLLHA